MRLTGFTSNSFAAKPTPPKFGLLQPVSPTKIWGTDTYEQFYELLDKAVEAGTLSQEKADGLRSPLPNRADAETELYGFGPDVMDAWEGLSLKEQRDLTALMASLRETNGWQVDIYKPDSWELQKRVLDDLHLFLQRHPDYKFQAPEDRVPLTYLPLNEVALERLKTKPQEIPQITIGYPPEAPLDLYRPANNPNPTFYIDYEA